MMQKKEKFKTKMQKFKSDAITSATFRKDGKMLAIGELDGRLHIVDTKRRHILRSHRKHTKPVHATEFLANPSLVASGSDDLTVKIFDVATNEVIRNFSDLHQDHIRALKVLSERENSLLVGSYDKTISLLDLRTLDQKPVRIFNHGFPVESIAAFSDTYRFASVGGSSTFIWDLRSDKPVYSFLNNLKTITSVKVNQAGTRLLTGSLDQHLKIFDLENEGQVCHQFKFEAGIMSFDLTNDFSHMIIGMNDGSLQIRQRKKTPEEEEEAKEEMPLPKIAGPDRKIVRNYRFFFRGIYEVPSAFDIQFEAERKRRLQEYDKYMKKFQYKNALNAALNKNNAHIVISLIEELVQRGTLDVALRNRDEEELNKLIEFIEFNFPEHRYRNILIPVIERILDLYSKEMFQSDIVLTNLHKLSNILEKALDEQKLMSDILGKLELILDSNIINQS